jgi:hypothetical protein
MTYQIWFLHRVPLSRHPDVFQVLEIIATGGGTDKLTTNATHFVNELSVLGVGCFPVIQSGAQAFNFREENTTTTSIHALVRFC